MYRFLSIILFCFFGFVLLASGNQIIDIYKNIFTYIAVASIDPSVLHNNWIGVTSPIAEFSITLFILIFLFISASKLWRLSTGEDAANKSKEIKLENSNFNRNKLLLFTLLFGFFWGQNIHTNEYKKTLLGLLLFWSLVPLLTSIIEFIFILFISEEKLNIKYLSILRENIMYSLSIVFLLPFLLFILPSLIASYRN